MAEVQLTAKHNILANLQQHSEQSESIYDTYLLERVNRNTTPDSTDMSRKGGEIDQNAKKFLKNRQHGQILNETSNEANIRKEINVLETRNIDLESSVARLLAENEMLNKENEHLKQTYKDLFDSIKKTSVQTKDYADSLIVQLNLIDPMLKKPHHMIAPGSSRNSSKESYASNDISHKYYLDEAKKKTQERDRKSTTSVMSFAKSQNTTKSCKSKPRGNNQTSRVLPTSKSSCPTTTAIPKAYHSRKYSPLSDFKHFVCSTYQKCVFNANHDACITKFFKEVNSRAKFKFLKTRISNKLVEPTSHTQKPGRHIVTRSRFSLIKSFVVHKKTNTPRSCLRWIPTGRIFNTAGLRWVPIGKKFTSRTTKVDCEPPNGSNEDITNPYECEQTLNVSACPINLSAETDNPNHVYKLKKALYGLKQALRAWYDMLSSFLISQDFSKGSVDPTIFIRREGKKLLLVQIYVDDIIFAASTPELCDLFSKIMCSKFKMSMMGKISFVLGLQISQSHRGIFINQSKYALESLKKYGFESCDPVDTPMVERSKLGEDKEGKAVDPSHYHDMIGTLFYLTVNRPDLQFAICMCSRSKHVEIRYHFIKEYVENGVIELYFVNTEYQLADIFTKALGIDRIEFLINKMGMRSFTSETLKQLSDEVEE
uniref:Retrovirus-related Pol polyprotein from transposon TNT 1-94 n=1 Tax=Tanacetum cinerariifolium TaxID=118510 RepID=A0A6L2JNJ0_TANCI|nr:retrovirus-related Pol polyprotein from transposon TNT 1-94 [Tanacetum cinerariifolium]